MRAAIDINLTQDENRSTPRDAEQKHLAAGAGQVEHDQERPFRECEECEIL